MSHSDTRANGPADNGTAFGELRELLNYRDGETLAVCWQHPQHRTHFASRFTTPAGAAAEVGKHADDADVWFSVNPIRKPKGGGRGTDGDVIRCAALFVDIDVKPGGVTDGETAEAITDDLSKALGQRPIAVVTTGHGWHIYWATDDGPEWVLDTSEKRTAARVLYRRVDRLARSIAKDRGCSVDNVGQLSRVLRVPGTVNRKADPIPVTLTTEYPYGGGGPVSFSGVLDVLDERDVPELAEDREQFGEVLSDPSGWQFGEATHPYVAAMIAGWRNDLPGNRHPWLVSQATRLACAHRLGLITAADHACAVEALASRFDWLLAHHGTPREADHGDAAAPIWGKQRAASFTDERAAADIGVDLDAVTDGEHQGDGNRAPVLPPEFWESRRALRHIRDAAWSMMASPDAVLAITLATLSASVPPCVRVDTGMNRPMPMHMFAAPVGRSGGFKTSAMEAAELAIKFVPTWTQDVFSTDAPIMVAIGDDDTVHRANGGTGQGIIENYMGNVAIPLSEDAEPRNGSRRRESTRKQQVRSNVLVTIDEGNGLAKDLADTKQIVGETLRELWSGVTTGQDNATAATTRRVKRGSYSFGLIVGFQLPVLARLLGSENVELGTPQRFLFAWTGAPDIPDERVPSPGVLAVTVPVEQIALCPALLDRLHGDLRVLLRNGGTDTETDSQRVSMLVRLAALLAVIDGRTEVSEDDWRLAEMIADTSRSIAEYALALKRGKDTQARKAKRAEEVEDALAVHTATTGSGADRAAVRIEAAIRANGGVRAKWTGDDGIRRGSFNSEDREDADAGLAQLVERNRATVTTTGKTQWVALID